MATKYNIPAPSLSPGGIGSAFDDLANTIANPPSDRPLQGAVGRAGQKYCDYLGAVPGAASGLLGPGFVTGSILCDPYWKKKGYTPPTEGPPFAGGQCPKSYRPEGTYINVNAAAGPTGLRNWRLNVSVTGPLRGWASAGSPVGTQWGFLSASNGGAPFGSAVDTGNNKPVFGPNIPGGTANMASQSPPTITSTGVQSGADDCGDGDPTPIPGPVPPPTPTFPPGEEPGVEPDGQPFFFVPPVDNPVYGGDDLDPIPETPGGGGTGGPTEPPTAGDEQEGAPGDENFPEPEEGTRWVGCCIRLTTIPVGTGTVPGTSPETILTQVVGNARLLFDSASGDGYDTPVQIRSAGLCLWEPVKGLSPTGVRVNLKPGFAYAFTPYSVPEEQ
jgi:hypothetical protein